MYTSTFTVRAQADPATMSRVINPLAQLALIPRHVEAATSGDTMRILIRQHGLSESDERTLAGKLLGCFLVHDVVVTRKRFEASEGPA